MTITLTRVKDIRDGQDVFIDNTVQTVLHVRRPMDRDDVAYVTILTLGGAEIVHEFAPEDLVEVVER